ncbi:UNVERIFIED_CONTAM: Solute carrier family 35 member E2 [Trichonephila clavipes]
MVCMQIFVGLAHVKVPIKKLKYQLLSFWNSFDLMDSEEGKPIVHREYYSPEHIGLSECIMEEKEPITVSRFDDEIPLIPDKNILKMKIGCGLLSSKAVLCIILWYFFSFTTLFLNKYILAYEQGDPTLLGSAQLLMCCVCGYLHLKYPCSLYKSVNWERSPPHFYRNMLMVGSLR